MNGVEVTTFVNWLDIILLGLATWRISSIIANEDGPYEVFSRFRVWAGEYWNYTTNAREATTPWGKGIICLFCTSVWIGILLSILYIIDIRISIYISIPFALSSIAVVVNKFVDE